MVTSGGKSYLGGNTAVVNLLEDTTPPPAPSQLSGYKNNNQYHLQWKNPTHLIHLDELLADFSDGTGKMEAVSEDGANMAVSVADGALKCDYNLTKAWATTSADYVFSAATDMHQTPVLSFRLKGNGTSTDLRIVCKNMSANHEDWWFTESVNLSNADWQNVNLDLTKLEAFGWYTNTDDKNQMDGVVRISFAISTGGAVAGTFYLDDLHLCGDIFPAPDYAQTVIVRKDNTFPSSPSDGTEIYRGTAETCADPSAVVGTVYYYAAFAADDRNNWSAPDAGAQWKSDKVPDGTGIEQITNDQSPITYKYLKDGHLFISHPLGDYSALGQMVK